MKTMVFDIPDEAAMLQFGATLAKLTPEKFIIFLYGRLGAGKTTFARGFLQGFGYTGKVKSPTYTLVEPYEVQNQIIFHFDFYRLKDPQELEMMGIQDYFSTDAICLIEWPEHSAKLLPHGDLSCYIEPSLEGRQISLVSHSTQGSFLVERLLTQGKHAK